MAIENLPLLSFPIIHAQAGESFQVSYRQGRLRIEADNELAAAYAICQLRTAARSQSIADYIGTSHPRYPLRPIWLGSQQLTLMTNEIGLCLPSFLHKFNSFPLENDPSFKGLCHHLINLGYNAVILGHYKMEVWNSSSVVKMDLQKLCQAFHAFGLKVILKPSFRFWHALTDYLFEPCPLDPCYRQHLSGLLKSLQDFECDGLLWETGYHHPQFYKYSAAENMTIVELILEEARLIEKSLPPQCLLLYHLSSPHQQAAKQQTLWIPFLTSQLGPQTLLAFSAFAGDPCADYLSLHPMWDLLRRSSEISSTPLLPILNGGAIHQGEGLWPSLSLDLIDQVLSRCVRHPFAGVITLTQRLPTPEGLLACNLWVLGQALWRSIPVDLLAETWFQAYRPDLSFTNFRSWFKKVRLLTVELSLLRTLSHEKGRDLLSHEECRIRAEALLAQLQDLQASVQQLKGVSETSFITLSDYFQFFCRDARRLILHFLQCYNLPISHLLTGSDFHPSFWSEASQGTGQGLRATIKINFFEKPQAGEKGSLMERIYLENTLV